MATEQTAQIALKPSERLALINWFAGRKWKNYEDRRRRRRLRQALHLMPDHDYRIVVQPAGRNEKGEDLFRHVIELGRFVGPEDDRKFQRLHKDEGRDWHLFEVTLDQVDYLISKLKDEETPDGQADTILDIEDALNAIKTENYQAPNATKWADLKDESFVAVKDPEVNADEPE